MIPFIPFIPVQNVFNPPDPRLKTILSPDPENLHTVFFVISVRLQYHFSSSQMARQSK